MAPDAHRLAHRMMRSLVRRAPWWLALTGIVCGLSFALLVDLRTFEPRLALDISIASMLPADDPGRLYYDEVKELFGTGEVVLVALEDEDVFTVENLRRVQRISERVEVLDGVHHVSSLSTALNIRSEDGSLVVQPFFREVPSDDAGLADLRRRALADPIYAGNLVSRDGRVTVIAAQLLDATEKEIADRGVDAEIQAIAEEERGSAAVWIAGEPHIRAEMSRLVNRDLLLVPVTWFLMAIVVFVSFRTLRGVVIPIVTVQVSLLVTMGLVSLFYRTLNAVTVAAPPILVGVGLAYSMHMVSAYTDAIRRSEDDESTARQLVLEALGQVTIPIVFTAITTAAGFYSLVSSPLIAVRQFGVFCGSGVLITAVITLTAVPALLAVLPLPRRIRKQRTRDALDGLLDGLARFGLRRGREILFVSAAVAGLAMVGATRIEIGTDTVSSFRPDNAVRLDFERFNDRMGGGSAFEVVLEADEPGGFQDPVALGALESLQDWLAEQPEVGGSTSLADYVKAIHRGFNEDRADAYRLPDSREGVSQLLVIGANDELERFVDSEYRVARVVVRTSAMNTAAVTSIAQRTEARLEALGGSLAARVTGTTVLLAETQDELAEGQAISLAAAFLIIYALLSFFFSSFRMGFYALIPNALPVLIYFGILGWSGITLNVSTAIVACLVLGIAVDDTIHVLAHFSAAARRHADDSKGVSEALRTVGRPVTFTTIALCVGFMTLTLSEMTNQVHFGWLSALTLAAAWLVDVTLTPVIAVRIGVVAMWDRLALDLHAEPHEAIPLFDGLKASQARVVTEMARMTEHAAGHELCRVGDAGADVWVVIDGELTASIDTGKGSQVLRKLKRGDIIGEVGFYSGKRSADVCADTDVRLLRLGPDELERITRKHPRIGSRLHTNLSRVLADRLSSVTGRLG